MAEIFDILTIDNAVVDEVLDVGEVFETIATLTTVEREAGKYSLTVSFTPRFIDVLRSFVWHLIGDVVTDDYTHKNTDITNYEPYSYTYIVNHIGGIFTTTLESHKEVLASQLDFNDVSIIFKRIG